MYFQQGLYYNFEIFHVKKKQIPIDTVECKEVISAFAWEPKGGKFAYIHGEAPRISVSFHKIGEEKITLLSEFDALHDHMSTIIQFLVVFHFIRIDLSDM